MASNSVCSGKHGLPSMMLEKSTSSRMVFLILWCFGVIPSNILSMGTLAITICWVIQIVLTKIVWGMKFNNGVQIKGDMSEWLLALVTELLILAILLPQNNK